MTLAPLDPLLSLAFAVASGPGTYAVLLGSGVSRAAGIPTGWEIVLDLVRKVALADTGGDAEPDPAAWYRKTYGREPRYAELLEQLAASSTQRQQLLRSYFEPDEQDREEGRKLPTRAHHCVARLVQQGLIRVIVTTNFDRLLERALVEASVEPVVIDTADAAAGALPLVHSPCTVVKVHGDYLDTRLRNTADELSRFDPPIDALLDRVFDDYGLVVCGWSAEWDTALRDALQRCRSRRFPVYWLTRGKLRDAAQQLATLLGATIVRARNADVFFTDLSEKIESVQEMSQAHPASTPAAVATLKRYLAEDRHRIRLSDFINQAVEETCFAIADAGILDANTQPDEDTFKHRLQEYERCCETVLALVATAAYWGKEHVLGPLARAVERLARLREPEGGNSYWIDLRMYPAMLTIYAAGITAVAGEQWPCLAAVLSKPRMTTRGQRVRAMTELTIHRVFGDAARCLSPPRAFSPGSDYLYRVIRDPLRNCIPDDHDYDARFGQFEYLFALVYADFEGIGEDRKYFLAPPGRLKWRGRRDLDGLTATIEALERDDHPLLDAGLFSSSGKRFQAVRSKVDHFLFSGHL